MYSVLKFDDAFIRIWEAQGGGFWVAIRRLEVSVESIGIDHRLRWQHHFIRHPSKS